MNLEIKKKNIMGIVMSIMLMVFCVMKVVRGADIGNTTEGGVWNYITFAFYPIFAIYLFINREVKINMTMISLFLYVATSLFSLLMIGNLKLDKFNIFLLLMIAVPFLVYSNYYFYSESENIMKAVFLITYYSCLLLNLFTIVQYLFFNASRAMASDIYFSLCLFPFALMYIKKRGILIATVFLQFMAEFLSNKRTGFIAFVIGIVVYILIVSRQNGQRDFVRALRFVTICIVAVLALYFITKYLDETYKLNIYKRIVNMSEDKGSGRVSIYQSLIESYNDSTLYKKIFGHGLGSIKAVCGTSRAHNDFIEALYTYGIVPALCLVMFEVSVFVKAVKLIRKKSQYAAVFSFAVIIGMFLSMLSFFLCYFTYVVPMMAFMGIVSAYDEKIDSVDKEIKYADSVEVLQNECN